MSDPVALADPERPLAAPLPSRHFALHGSTPQTQAAFNASPTSYDGALDDITDSFNIDYLTLQHNAEIEHIRSQQQQQQQSKPRPRQSHSTAPHTHRRRQPQSTNSSSDVGGGSSERSLLEERCAMLERLLHKQSSEMEEYVNSTAQLYVKLSDQQGKLHDERRRREDKEKEGDEWRSKAEHLEREYDRLKTERERERDCNARLITALRREATDVRTKWVELEARHQHLTETYEAHERRYTQRIEDLERQRQQWERQKAEAEELREKVAQLKADNERLNEDAVRVGQLTAELHGMQDIVDRLRAERVSFEVDRGTWAEERKEREKEIRGLVERLMKEELEVERGRLEAATLRQQLQDSQETHAAERQAMQQRMEQQRTEHSQRLKQVHEQLADTQLQLGLLREENERLVHPDHHENQALKQQLISSMQQHAQLTQQLHDEQIRRVQRDGSDRDKDKHITALTQHRRRLIGRVWKEKQKLEVQRSFNRWSSWIGERRKRRDEETEAEKKKEVDGRNEQEERKRDKEGVDAALRELEDKMTRLEADRQRDEEKQRMREEVEEDGRRRRRQRDADDERESRMREAKNREKEERKEVESSDDDKRSPSRHRHRHTHYLSPSPQPSLSPHPALQPVSLSLSQTHSSSSSQSYGPLLSALLSMRGAVTSGASGDDGLTARMEALLDKMQKLQQMQLEHDSRVAEQQHSAQPAVIPPHLSARPSSAGATLTQTSAPATSASVAAGAELPIALLEPPMDAALLPPPPPTQPSSADDAEGGSDKVEASGRASYANRAASHHRSGSVKARPQSSATTASRTQRWATKHAYARPASASRKAASVSGKRTPGMSAFIEHAVSQQHARVDVNEAYRRGAPSGAHLVCSKYI